MKKKVLVAIKNYPSYVVPGPGRQYIKFTLLEAGAGTGSDGLTGRCFDTDRFLGVDRGSYGVYVSNLVYDAL